MIDLTQERIRDLESGEVEMDRGRTIEAEHAIIARLQQTIDRLRAAARKAD
ncbi:hypothetical protein [Bradyrhizobium guangdongense]